MRVWVCSEGSLARDKSSVFLWSPSGGHKGADKYLVSKPCSRHEGASFLACEAMLPGSLLTCATTERAMPAGWDTHYQVQCTCIGQLLTFIHDGVQA